MRHHGPGGIRLGDEGFVLPLLCQPCAPQPLVKLPEGLRCWAIDSGVRHAVTGIEYEAARAAAFVGYRMICEWENLSLTDDRSGRIPRFVEPRWNGYLSNVQPSVFRSRYEEQLPAIVSGNEILASKAEPSGSVHHDSARGELPRARMHALCDRREPAHRDVRRAGPRRGLGTVRGFLWPDGRLDVPVPLVLHGMRPRM